MRLRIIRTIFQKEITEALRDWVTLCVLLGVPLVVYPLTAIIMTQMVVHQAAAEDRRVSSVAVWGVGAVPLLDWMAPTNNRLRLERWLGIPANLRGELETGRLQPPAPTNSPLIPRELRLGLGQIPTTATSEPEDAMLRAARQVVASKQADAVLIVWPGFDEAVQRHALGRVSVYYDSVIPNSAATWSRLSNQLDRFRRHLVKERQQARELPEGFATALEVSERNVAPLQRQAGDMLGRLLPLMFIVFSVVGGMMAAVDMTAGEKERATMQTLLCAPVRPLEIVAGKFLAVWSIGLVSAAINVASLGFMIGRLAAAAHVQVVQFGTLATVLALLVPATWTIAALFLAVATLARDAKDAGNFLAPMMLLVMFPFAAPLIPGVELNSWTCFAPLANLSLLIHALMAGPVAGHLVFLTLLSSLAYAGLALALAARVFGRELILLGGPFYWRWLLRGDARRERAPTPGLVLTLFPLVLVGLFYATLALIQHGPLIILLVTQYGVLLLPTVALAVARKFPLAQTFSLRRPHWRSLLGAVLIGLTASAAVAGLVLRLAPPPEWLAREMENMLQLGDKQVPLWKLWLVVALTPALCEETFFRGLMISGLRRWGPWAAIGISALLFGLLHASIYQFLPASLLGLVLGYAVWRSGSLYCGILIHALNNGLIATLLWSGGGKDLGVQVVPWGVTLGALAIMGIGLALLTRPKSRSESRLISA